MSRVSKTPNTLHDYAMQNEAIATSILSTRNLDLCLLAVCSCALTLLCHQAGNFPASTVTASQSGVQSPPLSQVDLTIKSGLLTQWNQTEEEQEQE